MPKRITVAAATRGPCQIHAFMLDAERELRKHLTTKSLADLEQELEKKAPRKSPLNRRSGFSNARTTRPRGESTMHAENSRPEKSGASPAMLVAAGVVAHAAVAGWHGAAHTFVPVPLTPMQQAFVGVVIMLLPLVGAGLLWTRWRVAAAALITVTMLASLLFGIINHFVLDSPDHVLSVPHHDWQHGFVLSAALVAVSEAVGAVLAAFALWSWRRA